MVYLRMLLIVQIHAIIVVFTQPLCPWQDDTKSIRRFLSSRLVAEQKQKDWVYLTLNPLLQEEKDGFMPFLKALAQNEMQKASIRIPSRVVNSISKDDNRYLKHERVEFAMDTASVVKGNNIQSVLVEGATEAILQDTSITLLVN